MGGWCRRAVHVPPLSPFYILSIGYDLQALKVAVLLDT